MHHVLRRRLSRAFAAMALLGVAVTLTACVSDSQGNAFGPLPTPTASLSGLPTPVPTMAPIPESGNAALVAGAPITNRQYAEAVAQEIAALRYRAQQQGGQMPPEPQIRSYVLNNLLIAQAVVNLYAQRNAIKVNPADVQKQFDAAQAQNGGAAGFATLLKNYGLTPAGAKAQIRDSILQQRVMQRVAPLPLVNEAQARHILVKSKVLAQQLAAQVRSGASFAALAKKYSIDSGVQAQPGVTPTAQQKLQAQQQSSAYNGGWLRDPSQPFAKNQPTWLTPQTGFVAPVLNAILAMKPGEVRVVQSQFGYHVIQVTAHRRVSASQLDAQAQQQYGQAQAQRFSRWIAQQRVRDHVQVLVKGLPPSPVP